MERDVDLTSPDHQSLLSESEARIRGLVEAHGSFTQFALARHVDGSTQFLRPPSEFSDGQSAMTETIRLLLHLAKDGLINACIICTPMQVEGKSFAMLDVESKPEGRVLVLFPYKKRFFGGWSFGPKSVKGDAPRIFATNT
jgi:hypothetical protein